MIKNKAKLFLTLLSTILLFNNESVNAANATAYYNGNGGVTGISYTYNGKTYAYNDTRFKVVPYSNPNASYEAFCVDPGYSASSKGFAVTCSSAGSSEIIGCILNKTTDPTTRQLAIRMAAVDSRSGIPHKSLKSLGQAIQGYIGGGGTLTATGEAATNVLNAAKQAYNECITVTGSGASNEANSNPYNFQFKNKKVIQSDANGYAATYEIKSSKTINKNNLKISCENNECAVTINNWNGKEGSITVTVKPGVCSYTLQAYFSTGNNDNGGGNGNSCEVFYCTGTYSYQSVIYCGNPEEIDEPQAERTDTTSGGGSINGETDGTYNEIYCKDNKCNDETKINIPYFCDSGENTMTVEAPSDAKSCIIGGKDEAGNSYKDASIKSPYCSVYCKEDYEIKLPGAQYTNSGEYFDLNPTKIKLTKTCYAGGPKGATGGIDTEQYIKDIIQEQKDMIDAYNKYSERKAQTDAVAQNSPTSTVESKDCDGNTYSKKTTSSIPYTAYKITKCNENTGVCQISKEDKQTSVTWGKEYSTTPASTVSNSSTSLDGYSCTQNANGKYNCSRACSSTLTFDDEDGPDKIAYSTVQTHQDNIEEIIKDYKICFNWKFDICLDEAVDFKYSEPYSSINYDKANESIGDISSSYGTDLNGSDVTGATTLETISYTGCEESGCKNNKNEAKNISVKAKYAKKTREGNAEYDNTTHFQTNYPHGTIDTLPNGYTEKDLKENYEYLGAVFPVALKTEQGVYNWTLSFSSLGQYFDKNQCKTGRINDVANALGKTLSTDLGYACVYVVDCPECKYECVCPDNLPTGYECVVEKTDEPGTICKFIEPDPKCPDCDVYCVNCIFNGDDTYNYRTISLTDINPNERSLGVNWSNQKGQETEKEIESANESAYKKPEYSYTLTATQMKEIRDYNKEKGTYVATDLTYEDATIGDVKYTNFKGISSFLNTKGNKYFTENARSTEWKPWTGTTENGIGPSWK